MKSTKETGARGVSSHKQIPLSIPYLKGREWRYVKQTLDTAWVSSAGPFVNRFEDAVAQYLGRKHAVACSSGTAALHTALMAARVGMDEEVVLPALTFAAPAFAVRYTGAFPVFIDVDPDYWQIDVSKLRDFLLKECHRVRGKLINAHTKRTVRAIIPVHLLGHPVDMSAIMKVAKDFGLLVIEDAAESLGAEYKDQKVGSQADIACLSFNGNKIITAGGGGMISTDNRQFAERARYLTTQAKDDPIEYIHNEIGYNYRLSNVQAAIGLAQMERLCMHVEKKREIARIYDCELAEIEGIKLPQEAPWARSIFWLYTILVDNKRYDMDRRGLMKKLSGYRIQSRPLWHPLPSLPVFKSCYAYQISVANDLYGEALSLPSSVSLCRTDQRRIAGILRG
jgi:perosamine synthetase